MNIVKDYLFQSQLLTAQLLLQVVSEFSQEQLQELNHSSRLHINEDILQRVRSGNMNTLSIQQQISLLENMGLILQKSTQHMD